MAQRQTTGRRPRLPGGWGRFAAGVPIHLFRAGLGPLFGNRLLPLRHTGRVTALDRWVVLEVVSYDPLGGSWTVASGFGPKAAWHVNRQTADGCVATRRAGQTLRLSGAHESLLHSP